LGSSLTIDPTQIEINSTEQPQTSYCKQVAQIFDNFAILYGNKGILVSRTKNRGIQFTSVEQSLERSFGQFNTEKTPILAPKTVGTSEGRMVIFGKDF
jgi:excinuclease UvrABC ATPase subunit